MKIYEAAKENLGLLPWLLKHTYLSDEPDAAKDVDLRILYEIVSDFYVQENIFFVFIGPILIAAMTKCCTFTKLKQRPR